MAKVLVTESYLSAIGDAIRSKNLSSVAYTPGEMAQAILDIPVGSGGTGYEDDFITCSYNGPYINERVTEINSNLFRENPNLTVISFSKVTSVVDEVFKESSVQAAYFPSLENVSKSAFENCQDLTAIEMGKVLNVGANAFADCPKLASISLDSAKTIEETAFSNCSSLSNIILPSVETFGINAFSGCSGLVNVSMPNLKSVNDNGFYGCQSLINVEMPKVESVGISAFEGDGLTNISLPKVTSVSEYAFKDCSSLVSIDFPKILEVAGRQVFSGCNVLTTVNMPNLITIGPSMFHNCSSLESINLPLANKALNDVGYSIGTFSGCISLKSVDMAILKEACPHMFEGCSSLTDVNLPAVVYLDDSAFRNCISLKTISLPNLGKDVGVRGTNYFKNCSALEYVDLPELTILPKGAFESCVKLTSWNLPSVGIIDTGAFNINMGGSQIINCHKDFPSLMTINPGGLKGWRRIKHFIWDNRAGSLSTVWNGAFNNCNHLELIDFHYKAYVQDYSFEQIQNLKAVVFREGFDFYEGYTTLESNGYCYLFKDDPSRRQGYTSGHTTPMNNNEGYCYVPRDLLDANGRYKEITNVRFRAIEDYTVDGTITGALDLVKMGLEEAN